MTDEEERNLSLPLLAQGGADRHRIMPIDEAYERVLQQYTTLNAHVTRLTASITRMGNHYRTGTIDGCRREFRAFSVLTEHILDDSKDLEKKNKALAQALSRRMTQNTVNSVPCPSRPSASNLKEVIDLTSEDTSKYPSAFSFARASMPRVLPSQEHVSIKQRLETRTVNDCHLRKRNQRGAQFSVSATGTLSDEDRKPAARFVSTTADDANPAGPGQRRNILKGRRASRMAPPSSEMKAELASASLGSSMKMTFDDSSADGSEDSEFAEPVVTPSPKARKKRKGQRYENNGNEVANSAEYRSMRGRDSFVPLSRLPDKRCHQQSRSIAVEHSVGRPRTVMNTLFVQNNLHLGIHASFGQCAFSMKGGKISHFVLSKEWNEFVTSRHQTQRLFIGKGPCKEKMAEMIANFQGLIPIFYDPKEDTCIHYIGDYKVIPDSIERYSAPAYALFMGKERCMKMDLRFVEFNQNIARVVLNEPCDIRYDKRAIKA